MDPGDTIKEEYQAGPECLQFYVYDKPVSFLDELVVPVVDDPEYVTLPRNKA